jgi:GST-like protein
MGCSGFGDRPSHDSNRRKLLIDFYTASTVNGYKVAIALEELGLPYTVHDLDLGNLDQKKPEYLKINPNGRIPAIYDRETDTAIFESGACLIYLTEKTGKLTGADPAGRGRVNSWLFLQVSGVGPMQGQANVFLHYFGEDLPRVAARYVNETKRLYGIVNDRLGVNEWLADDYSIADIAMFPWMIISEYANVSLDDYPNIKAWTERMHARPAVQRGLAVPPKREIKDRAAAVQAILQR